MTAHICLRHRDLVVTIDYCDVNDITASYLLIKFIKCCGVFHSTHLGLGHFGDESYQAINYTGTDNEKITN